MRSIRYCVAMSLDGYIAGPNGEADWIIMDPEIDFGAYFAQFDTLLIGRNTYEGMQKTGQSSMPGMKMFVFSRTLQPQDHPEVTMVGEADLERIVSELRAAPGKDIWLFGGGLLFRSLLEVGLVDAVEVAIIPTLLGQGIPLLPAPMLAQTKLELIRHRLYAKSGIVSLEYAVQR